MGHGYYGSAQNEAYNNSAKIIQKVHGQTKGGGGAVAPPPSP